MKDNTTESVFTASCLPYGIFSEKGLDRFRIGVAYMDRIIDLHKMSQIGLFDDVDIEPELFSQDTLNDFMNQGKAKTNRVRKKIQWFLTNSDPIFSKNFEKIIVKQSDCKLKMPVRVGDYVDFYSSEFHATNVGKLFRSAENALMPNWKHLPVGYHGRASSIVISGEKIYRPSGQIYNSSNQQPEFRPTDKLDFELEIGMVIGRQSNLNQPISIHNADDHIFGFVLFNDWSARDIQSWEYRPLGPFLGKSFISSISPWVVPLEALKPYKIRGPVQSPAVLDYLKSDDQLYFDIELEVWLKTSSGLEEKIVTSNTKQLYWSFGQQLAHYTSNGCHVRSGDILATGTISGPERNNQGCMLEISENGKYPLFLSNGESRSFLQDGDSIVFKGRAGMGEDQVFFGELENTIKNSL